MANISDAVDDLFYSYKGYDEYKAGVLIWKVVSPILIILGTAGNCLSITVLTRRPIRSSSISLYLSVLSVTDLVVLYSGLLRQWLIYQFDYDIRHASVLSCKLNIWIVYSSLDFSAWILVGVTLERMISAWSPHRTQTVWDRKRPLALLIAFGAIVLALNCHFLYGLVFKDNRDKSSEQSNIEKCVEIDDAYYEFFNIKWPWIDLCAFCAFPLTIIVVANGMILLKLIGSHRKLQTRQVETSAIGTECRQRTPPSKYSKISSTSSMLFALNAVFLLSTLPISIYNIGYTHWANVASEHDYAKLDLWWAIVNMLMYVNNSINFVLYCLSGTKFRREVFRIFFQRRQNRVGIINVQQSPGNI